MSTGDLVRLAEGMTEQELETLEWAIAQARQRRDRQAQRTLQASFMAVR